MDQTEKACERCERRSGEPGKLVGRLRERGIYVVCREGLVRASPRCYNTREEEVGTFLEVLEDA